MNSFIPAWSPEFPSCGLADVYPDSLTALPQEIRVDIGRFIITCHLSSSCLEVYYFPTGCPVKPPVAPLLCSVLVVVSNTGSTIQPAPRLFLPRSVSSRPVPSSLPPPVRNWSAHLASLLVRDHRLRSLVYFTCALLTPGPERSVTSAHAHPRLGQSKPEQTGQSASHLILPTAESPGDENAIPFDCLPSNLRITPRTCSGPCPAPRGASSSSSPRS